MMSEKNLFLSRKNSPHKERGACVIIPNIPKLLDERARIRLLCDYEKYEVELFKHHIGTPETTKTIGLKQFPGEFDRRVPLLGEPTLAERSWEARKNRLKAMKQGPAGSGVKVQPPRRGAANVQAAQCATEAGQGGRAQETSLSTSISAPVQENGQQPALPQQRQRPQRDAKETAKQPQQVTVEPKVQDAPVTVETTKTATVNGKVSPELLQSKTAFLSSQSTQPKRKKTLSRDMRQRLLTPTPHSKTSVSTDISVGLPHEKNSDSWSAAHCGRLLSVLLDPPDGYEESFHLDLGNIDLRWMRKSHYPSNFLTLHTWRGNEDNDVTASLNSPRSVIVLLRNGIVVRDLIPNTSITDLPLPQDSETRQIVKTMRFERRARRCEALLQKLRKEYGELCTKVGLGDLLAEFHRWRKREGTLELPTTIKTDHERQQRTFEVEQKRVEKQLAFAKEMHERQLSAEKRQKQLEEEALLKLALKKEEERMARERLAERLAAQQQKKAEMEAFYLRGLQERQARAEELCARRVEAQQRLKELRHENRLRRAEERKRLFERVAERQEEKRQQIQQKYEMKEERLQRLREEQERRNEAMHRDMLARAAKSAELRRLARERAALHEEQLHRAALEQQQRVNERLSRFHQEREEARTKRAQQGEIKRARREQVFTEAANRLNTFKEKVLEKHAEQEKKYEDSQQQRQVDSLARAEQDNDEREQKIFAVQRKKRIAEFGKLGAVLRLLSKRETSDFVERQRNLLLNETRKAREAMALNISAAKDEMVLRRRSP